MYVNLRAVLDYFYSTFFGGNIPPSSSFFPLSFYVVVNFWPLPLDLVCSWITSVWDSASFVSFTGGFSGSIGSVCCYSVVTLGLIRAILSYSLHLDRSADICVDFYVQQKSYSSFLLIFFPKSSFYALNSLLAFFFSHSNSLTFVSSSFLSPLYFQISLQ